MIGSELFKEIIAEMDNDRAEQVSLEKSVLHFTAKNPLILAVFVCFLQLGALFLWKSQLLTMFPELGHFTEIFAALIGIVIFYSFFKWIFGNLVDKMEVENGKIREMNSALTHMNQVTTLGLSRATEVRDSHTSKQIRRIGTMASRIAAALSEDKSYGTYLSKQYIKDIRIAAPLYDIGRIGLPDSILEKDVGLTSEEFETMKMHVIIGGDLVSELQKTLPYRTYFSLAKEIVYHHHQRWDGAGYPNVLKNGDSSSYFIQESIGAPLKGDEIPLSARIVSVTDVYNALISDKAWRVAFSHEEACALIQKGSGHQFDPKIVDAFMRCSEDIRSLCETL